MSYFNLRQSYYLSGETCAGIVLPANQYFYKTFAFTPKKAGLFSSKLKEEGRDYYCMEISDTFRGYQKKITFFENGVNTDIIFKGWNRWIYIPKNYRNNSIPYFCLPVKIWDGREFKFGIYSFPYDKHRYLGDINNTYKLTSEAVAVLFGYISLLASSIESNQRLASVIKTTYKIEYKLITEIEYQSYL